MDRRKFIKDLTLGYSGMVLGGLHLTPLMLYRVRQISG
jgi:hypothetical protein